MLNTTTAALGCALNICLSESSPLLPGAVMSSNTMSHWLLLICSSASSPLFASPNDALPNSTARICFNPCRTITWFVHNQYADRVGVRGGCFPRRGLAGGCFRFLCVQAVAFLLFAACLGSASFSSRGKCLKINGISRSPNSDFVMKPSAPADCAEE